MRHVVAVADVAEGDTGQTTLLLADRLQVGKRLARMRVVREGVDDRDVSRAGNSLDAVLAEGPHDDRGDVARQHGGGVLDALTTAELRRAGVDDDRMAAELRDADLERQPRAGRRLLEHDCDGTWSGQRPGRVRVLFQPVRLVEDELL